MGTRIMNFKINYGDRFDEIDKVEGQNLQLSL